MVTVIVPNFLVDEEGNMSLIDWEYSGMGDANERHWNCCLCCYRLQFRRSKEFINKYFEKNPSVGTERHFLGMVGFVLLLVLMGLFPRKQWKTSWRISCISGIVIRNNYCTEALRLYEEEKLVEGRNFN